MPTLSEIVKIAQSSLSSKDSHQADSVSLDAAILEMIFNGEGGHIGSETQQIAWRLSSAALNTAKKLRSTGDSVRADEAVRKAAFLNVQDERAWTLFARYALDAEDYVLADAASLRAVMIEPHSAEAAGIRAEVLFALDQRDSAESYLLASIVHGAKDANGSTDAVFRCRERIAKEATMSSFQAVADAAVSLDKRAEAIAAFTKGAAWSRKSDMSRMLLSLCDYETCESAEASDNTHTPLVLISQIQRSGGSLIAQLFDGHPEIFAHPHELHIGRPQKWNWPNLDLSKQPLDILNDLFETVFLKFIVRGYSKGDGNKAAANDLRRFTFSIENLIAEFRKRSESALLQRDVIDAYLRAFFIAWGEYAVTGKERYVTAFCPRLSSYPESTDGFFKDYPDGRMICCIREPASWYASSSRHDKEYEDIERALELWRASTQGALKLATKRPDMVHLLTYDDLVADTRNSMNRIAHWLGIRPLPSLTTPTFAGQSVMPNSSFVVEQFGVHRRSLEEPPDLSKKKLALIGKAVGAVYDEALTAIAAQNSELQEKSPLVATE